MQKKDTKNCFIICPNPSIDVLAYIDKIDAKESNRITDEKRFPGGKGIHVALALAEMNIPTTLVGFWGEQNGTWLRENCHTLQPHLKILGPTISGGNRTCYTFQSNREWQDTEILGIGPTVTDNNFNQLVNIIHQQASSIECIAICGSWPKGAKSTYNQQIVNLGHNLNIPVYLDCTGEQLKNALESKPFCVHLNRSETEQYFNTDFENARKSLIEFCEIAAITDGSKGLYLQNSSRTVHANVKIENIKSTVGSGDCLMAGIIAGHHRQLTFEDIARLGAASGAANCINEDLGMLLKKDVDKLFPEVATTSLKQ